MRFSFASASHLLPVHFPHYSSPLQSPRVQEHTLQQPWRNFSFSVGLVSHHTHHHARSLTVNGPPCQAGAPTLNRAQMSLSSLSRAHSFFLAASWSWELRHREERLSMEKKSEIS